MHLKTFALILFSSSGCVTKKKKEKLLDNEILQDSRICEKSGNSSSLKIGSNETLLYRCQKAGFQARSNIT
ncbi:hypothetical protein HZS_2332 [Henneguya salminicola]|nr:hypothetical protein HZS_2332 [Henneguya salminicola]